MNKLAIGACALLLAACSAPADVPSVSPTAPTASSSADPAAFTVTSLDFADGAELADSATASGLGGQCDGDNLNPALEWSNVPEGTQAFAITFIDRSANNFIHWVHFDIPGDVTGVDKGASATLGGSEGDKGSNGADADGYFGPCPPGPNHRYEFTVYALDAPLGLEAGTGFSDVKAAIDAHELAEASITGMRSGPAS